MPTIRELVEIASREPGQAGRVRENSKGGAALPQHLHGRERLGLHAGQIPQRPLRRGQAMLRLAARQQRARR